MKKLVVVGIAAVSLAALGCGGGGGGGGGGISIGYNGEKSQVALDESNFEEVAAASADGGEVGMMLGEIPVAKAPAALGKLVTMAKTYGKSGVLPMADAETYDCENGGEIRQSADETSTGGTIKIVWDECADTAETGGYLYDGFVKLTISQTESGGEYTDKISIAMDLTVDDEYVITTKSPVTPSESPSVSDLPTLRGYLTFTEQGVVSSGLPTHSSLDLDLLVGNQYGGESIWFKDVAFDIEMDEGGEPEWLAMEGRIYFSDLGYVDYYTDEDIDVAGFGSGVLIIDGANGSGIKIVYASGGGTAYLETGDGGDPPYDDAEPYTFGYF